MKKYSCEMCGKTVLRVDDHHIIPWEFSHDDSESNIAKVCRSCHKKADGRFLRFIVYGDINIDGNKKSAKRSAKRYNKLYTVRKKLKFIKLMKYVYYCDMLAYNIRTESIHIYSIWSCSPYVHGTTRLKSRAQLSKAALSKGQTILIGK